MGIGAYRAVSSEAAAYGAVSAQEVRADQQQQRLPLRNLLYASDLAAALTGWVAVLLLAPPWHVPDASSPRRLLFAALATTAMLGFVNSQRLYLSRVCAVRAVEVQRIGRAAMLSALFLFTGKEFLEIQVAGRVLLVGAAVSGLLLVIARGAFRAWVRSLRRSGVLSRPIVVVGTNDDAEDLIHDLEEHPEMGFQIMGVLGPDPDTATRPWLGSFDDAIEVITRQQLTGVVLVASAIPSDILNSLTRQLLELRVHVHVASGLRGFAAERLVTVPVAYEPLLYVEPPTLAPVQLKVKRAIDLSVAALAAMVALPLMLITATVIKLHDGGPVLFRQQRVGKDGEIFWLYKFRTMVVGAEHHIAHLHNERQGPLFKAAHDPRVTGPGHLLRAASIDELPQLWNVLRGNMSLIGPRPALPEEVELFDEELQGRTRVPPGISGLWQIEARDNPAFGLYRRLDLFYVENWSVSLDLSILLTTVGAVLLRAARATLPGHAGSGGELLPRSVE